jgi:hypothetical protein
MPEENLKTAATLLICLALTGCDITVGTTAPVTIQNGLGGWSIHYVQLSRPGAKGWSDDMLGPTEIIRPGASRVFQVQPGPAGIRVTDSDGDTYTLRDIEIPEEGFTWEVTLDQMDSVRGSTPDPGGDCPVTVMNSLNVTVEDLRIYRTGEEPGRDNLLESPGLPPGDEFILWVEQGSFDMTAVDGMGRTLAAYNCPVDVNGFFWEITEHYVERQP